MREEHTSADARTARHVNLRIAGGLRAENTLTPRSERLRYSSRSLIFQVLFPDMRNWLTRFGVIRYVLPITARSYRCLAPALLALELLAL